MIWMNLRRRYQSFKINPEHLACILHSYVNRAIYNMTVIYASIFVLTRAWTPRSTFDTFCTDIWRRGSRQEGEYSPTPRDLLKVLSYHSCGGCEKFTNRIAGAWVHILDFRIHFPQSGPSQEMCKLLWNNSYTQCASGWRKPVSQELSPCQVYCCPCPGG
jgi:hypothetical protein